MDYKNGFTFIFDRYSMRFVSRNIVLYQYPSETYIYMYIQQSEIFVVLGFGY